MENQEATKEQEEIACETCQGTGYIEIMGGSDSDEWGVIDTGPCPDCRNYND